MYLSNFIKHYTLKSLQSKRVDTSMSIYVWKYLRFLSTHTSSSSKSSSEFDQQSNTKTTVTVHGGQETDWGVCSNFAFPFKSCISSECRRYLIAELLIFSCKMHKYCLRDHFLQKLSTWVHLVASCSLCICPTCSSRSNLFKFSTYKANHSRQIKWPDRPYSCI